MTIPNRKFALLDEFGKRPVQLGYNAVKHNPSRARPKNSIRSEDEELNRRERQLLIATTRDQLRNVALVSWMFRKHLDYVSQFNYHASTGDQQLDADLELLWKEYSLKDNCDIAGRHPLSRMIRIFEACKVTDGDAGLIKINNGMLQGVEGSRIAKPYGAYSKNVSNISNINDQGLVLNKEGRVLKYSIVDIKNGQKRFSRLISAKNMLFDGYFVRFNQTRGVSPLASALNLFQDLYESWEYQLIKSKMHAMFGVAIYSDPAKTIDSGFDSVAQATGQTGTSQTVANRCYEFELKPGLKLELDQGDKIETIESKTPSAEFKDYTELMVRIGMLSLDIPYSFYDSRQSSFSAMKQDRVEYETSAKVKQESNHDVLMQIGKWKHNDWFNKGLIKVDPRKIKFEFRAAGRPWLEELKEINAAMLRIDSGLSSRQRECKKRGEDFFEIMKELKKEKEIIKKSGVNIVSGMPGQPTIEERDANVEATEGQ